MLGSSFVTPKYCRLLEYQMEGCGWEYLLTHACWKFQCGIVSFLCTWRGVRPPGTANTRNKSHCVHASLWTVQWYPAASLKPNASYCQDELTYTHTYTHWEPSLLHWFVLQKTLPSSPGGKQLEGQFDYRGALPSPPNTAISLREGLPRITWGSSTGCRGMREPLTAKSYRVI